MNYTIHQTNSPKTSPLRSKVNQTYKRILISFALVFVNAMVFAQVDKPNILFICIDDMRPEIPPYGDDFGLFDKAIAPNMEALARESIVFKRAYTSYPVCLASRTSLFSGYRIDWNKANPDYTSRSAENGISWPVRLKTDGYWIAASGKVTHGYEFEEFWEASLDNFPARDIQLGQNIKDQAVATGGRPDLVERFRTDTTYRAPGDLVWQSVDVADNELPDGIFADEAIDYIRNQRDPSKPFCIFAGFIKPHLPLVAPKKYFDMYDDVTFEVPAPPPGEPRRLKEEDRITKKTFQSSKIRNYLWNEGMSDEETKSVIKAYFACISYVDALVGEILQALDDEGLTDSTVICLWSDHGYLLGEHGKWRKQHHYHLSNLLAFMMKVPGKSPGNSYSVIETCDIYPTMLELAGVDYSNQGVHGKSLVPIINDVNTILAPNVAAAGGGPGYYTLISPQYSLSTSSEPTSQNFGNASKMETKLFDIINDPIEWYNLASLPQYREYIKTSVLQLSELWKIDFEPEWPEISDRDSDGNGVLDRDEQIFVPGSNFVLFDSDNDGVPNYLDTDS